jgi:type IV secretory pathway VirB2 component (pilin)
MYNQSKRKYIFILYGILCCFFSFGFFGIAYADDIYGYPTTNPDGSPAVNPGTTGQAAGAALPWEGPLCALSASFAGTTAKAIALIGLFVAGGLLVFGGELSDFARRITWMVLAVSVMLSGETFLSMINNSPPKCSSHLGGKTYSTPGAVQGTGP